MSGMAWGKFYWNDWAADPKLRLCSAAAQGLWMRMLCICAEADGYLTIADRPLSSKDLAAITGWPEHDVLGWMEELERWGVYSIDGKARIYSRRMIADRKKLKAAKKNGREGGNPKLKGGYNKPGFIYIMGPRSDGFHKIGVSVNPDGRLKKIKAQYPGQNIRVVDVCPVPDMGAAEADLHQKFAGTKQGEWFRLTALQIREIRENWQTHKGLVEARLMAQKLEARNQKLEELESPTSEKAETQQNGQAVRRGTRLPVGWEGDGEAVVHAIREGFNDTEAFTMLDDFRDFWSAKAGADGCKLDWMATWRRWVREESKRRARGRIATGPPKRVGWV